MIFVLVGREAARTERHLAAPLKIRAQAAAGFADYKAAVLWESGIRGALLSVSFSCFVGALLSGARVGTAVVLSGSRARVVVKGHVAAVLSELLSNFARGALCRVSGRQ